LNDVFKVVVAIGAFLESLLYDFLALVLLFGIDMSLTDDLEGPFSHKSTDRRVVSCYDLGNLRLDGVIDVLPWHEDTETVNRSDLGDKFIAKHDYKPYELIPFAITTALSSAISEADVEVAFIPNIIAETFHGSNMKIGGRRGVLVDSIGCQSLKIVQHGQVVRGHADDVGEDVVVGYAVGGAERNCR
jgi:hypothetical protein